MARRAPWLRGFRQAPIYRCVDRGSVPFRPICRLAACPRALVVSGLGSASYDVFAAGDRPENFYLWGAMGAAAAVGLGLALAQPDRPVLVITGHLIGKPLGLEFTALETPLEPPLATRE